MSRWGFATSGAWRAAATGLAAGFTLMAATLAAMSALGGYQFGAVALAPAQIPGSAALYALFALSVAVFEETLFRSFVLVQLSRAFGFWPAAVVTAALFGLAHSGNLGEAPFGLLVAALGGLVFAYAFWRTGALWFSIGFHAAFAYAEDFVFGVPDSGNVQQGALLHPLIHGPDWLTGGKVGPEGSLLALAAILAAALVVRFALPRRAAGD
jgi:membrane protease YdiL (CAAX protease family)